MITAFESDRGKVRAHNEDAGGVFMNTTAGACLALVADGMGGHRAGDVASNMTVHKLQQAWEEITFTTSGEAEDWLKKTIADANTQLYEYAKAHDECQGMGTTVVAAICTQEYVVVAHIGDSRCYIKNSFGFKQITSDHSLVNELVRSGQITAKDAEHHPRKNVLMRALGTEEGVNIDVKTLTWEDDDVILLCSDGLTNKVSDEKMIEIVTSQLSPDKQAAQLISEANAQGGEDNITVALVRYEGMERESE